MIFGLKAQKSPLDHVLDSKMQTTRRMSVLVTLFERYDPNKAFPKKFWVPVTWEKIFRDQQSQRGNLSKLSFWTDFDWTGLIFGLKTQKTPLNHVLDSKMQTTRHVGVLVTLFERYDPNKAFAKKFWVPVTWEKNFRDQQSQRSNLPKLSFWTDFDWTGLIFDLKTQKTPLDHVLDSKMQTTHRVGVLVTLFESLC